MARRRIRSASAGIHAHVELAGLPRELCGAVARGREDPALHQRPTLPRGYRRIDIERSANRRASRSRPPGLASSSGGRFGGGEAQNELQARTGKRSTSTSRRSSIRSWTPSSSPRSGTPAPEARRVPPRDEEGGHSALRLGADGIRIACAGRLGAARSRGGMVRDGRVPLHTIRATSTTGSRLRTRVRHDRRQGVGLQGEVLGAAPRSVRPPTMLMPKRVKYRKATWRMKGKAQRGSTLAFGDTASRRSSGW